MFIGARLNLFGILLNQFKAEHLFLITLLTIFCFIFCILVMLHAKSMLQLELKSVIFYVI